MIATQGTLWQILGVKKSESEDHHLHDKSNSKDYHLIFELVYNKLRGRGV